MRRCCRSDYRVPFQYSPPSRINLPTPKVDDPQAGNTRVFFLAGHQILVVFRQITLGWDRWRTLNAASPRTTISRAVARCSLEQLRAVFARWVVSATGPLAAVTAAADGKTSKQGHDADGEPIHMLNVFAHELGLCLAQFPVTGGKPTEPQTLKHALEELLQHYPFIQLFTGDALFTQRPLARVLLEAERDYLFAVKDNQPDLLEDMTNSMLPPTPDTIEKGQRDISGSRYLLPSLHFQCPADPQVGNESHQNWYR